MENLNGVIAQLLGHFSRKIGRCDEFVPHGGIFGVVVIEFVAGHHLGNSKHSGSAIHGGNPAGKLAPAHELLHHQLVVIFERFREGLVNLTPVVHFRDPHAGTRVTRLDKARITTNRLNLLIVNGIRVIKMQGWRDGHTEAGHRQIAIVFVERQCGAEHPTTRIRLSHQFKIGLQTTILTGRSVDGYERCVKLDFFSMYGNGEIVLVHLANIPVFIGIMPVSASEMDQVRVEQTLVQLIEDVIGCFQGDFIFAGISTGYYGNIIHNHTILSSCAKIRFPLLAYPTTQFVFKQGIVYKKRRGKEEGKNERLAIGDYGENIPTVGFQDFLCFGVLHNAAAKIVEIKQIRGTEPSVDIHVQDDVGDSVLGNHKLG